MTERIVTPRELNRATLLVLDAIERLVGLQAEQPSPPFIGLWTRLRGFRRDDLTGLLARRAVVRGPLMRSTLHLATAADYLALRPALQPALTRALYAFFGRRARGWDINRLVAAARRRRAARPARRRRTGSRHGGAGLRRAEPSAAGAGPDRATLGLRRRRALHHDGVLARAGAGAFGRPARADPALPGGVRPGDDARHPVGWPGAADVIDGQVGGVWRIERARDAATLVIAPFAPLSKAGRAALADEGEWLVRFVEDGA